MLKEEINNVDNLKDLFLVAKKVNNIEILSNDNKYFLNEKILLKNFLYILIANQKNKIIKNQNNKIRISALLKNKLLSRKTLFSLFIRYPSINRDIGEIPYIFLKGVKNKQEVSKKIFDLLAKYSHILNYDYLESKSRYFCVDIRTNELSQELSKIINKKTEIVFSGNGCNGNGFLIKIFDNDIEYKYFYKVFYPRIFIPKNGSDVETMYAYFANKNGRKNQFAKFYMGRIASPFEKDAFMLTEYLERNPEYKNTGSQLFIDYILSLDNKLNNAINGKTVDFGGLVENIPSLRSKKMRKLVRIILMSISHTVDKNNIKYTWSISRNNIEVIKNCADKYGKTIYRQALKIIKKNIIIMPQTLIAQLNNIQKNKENSIFVYKYLQTEDIITRNILTLKRNIKTLNIRIKSSMDGSENMFGYIILDLFNNRFAMYMLDKNNNITKIRLEKMIDNNQFKTLLELNGEQIDIYQNDNISELLCS